ncbi:MAG: hypothetical protein AAF411_16650 [Myxococcota bacterium]
MGRGTVDSIVAEDWEYVSEQLKLDRFNDAHRAAFRAAVAERIDA